MYDTKCLAIVGIYTTRMTAVHVSNCTGHAADVADNGRATGCDRTPPR
jgi:hypothetical protein